MTYTPAVGDRVRFTHDNLAYTGVIAHVFRFCGVLVRCDSGAERYLSADRPIELVEVADGGKSLAAEVHAGSRCAAENDAASEKADGKIREEGGEVLEASLP